MVLQVIIFLVYTIELIYEFYDAMINVKSTYELAINISDTYVWATINFVKMIVFNYICEGLCSKVHKFTQNTIQSNYNKIIIEYIYVCVLMYIFIFKNVLSFFNHLS